MPRPRERLLGLTLPGGWRIVEQIPKLQTETGSNFSTGYIVEGNDGRRYFLKAIDFSSALHDPDPARALQQLTEAFNLERDVLNISKRLSCVVTAIEDGKLLDPGQQPTDVVQYIIFELADDNLRRMAVVSKRLPMSVGFKALHNVANGLRQLHQQQVAHQDTKPSNVLRFGERQYKVGDLGRCSVKGRVAPHDDKDIAGDPAYAPPELLYGQTDPEFVVRRFGADAYLLGSLAAFLVTGIPMTALLIRELDPSARPKAWGGTYAAVMSQVQAAYARALERVAEEIPDAAPYKKLLLETIGQLCDPDTTRRGHPSTRFVMGNTGNPYDLERYVSIFNRLAFEAHKFEQMHKSK